MRISIFGLGYVGAVSLACLARDGHQVIGVDVDLGKLDLIRRGKTPIIEEGMVELMATVMAGDGVQVTQDARWAVQHSDISFVCVGTPSRPNGSQDLSAVMRLAEQLGEALRDTRGYHVIVIRSTVAPGTVEDGIRPLLEAGSVKRAGNDFGLCFQPEFLREGSSIRDYDSPPFTIVGADSPRAIEPLRELFQHLPCEFLTTSIRTAEMLKVCCNAFHALKVSFANEIGRVCQPIGVDPHSVMELLCRDTRLNISPAYLRPGFAFGGSCLPKDLRAIKRLARDHDVEVPVLAGILESNYAHIDHAIDYVLASGRRAIGMLGLSFKSGTDDLRESPLVMMAERFIGKGLNLKICDPQVSLARLVGANRRYIEESIPHIASLMYANWRDVIDASDVLIVGHNDPALLAELRAGVGANHLILDLVGLPGGRELAGEYRGVCW